MTEAAPAQSLLMVNDDLRAAPSCELAPDFTLHWYVPGDEKAWLAIHESADNFNSITPELFDSQFMKPDIDLSERQFYLLDSHSHPIATATAWHQDNGRFKGFGRLHWVAVVPERQNCGIGKMAVSIACRRMIELGYTRSFLETDTRRPAAIHLYEKFGFRIESRKECGQHEESTTEQAYGFRPAQSKCQPGQVDAAHIKDKARELGADLVGISLLNRDLLKSGAEVLTLGETVDFKTVITIGVAMNPEAFRASPSRSIRDETREGYRRMKKTACALGDYVAALGYNAFSTGNGEAMSVALALDSGLGKLGRNGMLLSEAHGSCLRLCKVFTDMPLDPDTAPASHLDERCETCNLCSEACPADAIERDTRPATGRWIVDEQNCRKHWSKMNHECAACISVCPATWE